MKWIAYAKNPPVSLQPGALSLTLDEQAFLSVVPATLEAAAAPPPAPKDIPIGLALTPLVAHGVYIKSISTAASYSCGELPQIELNMVVQADPEKGAAALAAIAEWCTGKMPGGGKY